MTQLSVGERYRSVACATEVIVLAAPGAPVDLACGGSPMVPADSEAPSEATLDPQFAGETLVGKRYWHQESGLEVLCTKRGEGSLSVDGAVLEIKAAASLPASD